MYVELFVRLTSKLGRCVADDPRMCMRVFGAVWTRESLDINKKSCHTVLICFFFWVESLSENMDSATLPNTNIVVEVGIASELFTAKGAACHWAVQPRQRRGQETSPVHNVYSFALVKDSSVFFQQQHDSGSNKLWHRCAVPLGRGKKSAWKGACDLVFLFVRLFHNQNTKFIEILRPRLQQRRMIHDSTKILNISVFGWHIMLPCVCDWIMMFQCAQWHL